MQPRRNKASLLCAQPNLRLGRSLSFERRPDTLVHGKQECHDTDHSHSLVSLRLVRDFSIILQQLFALQQEMSANVFDYTFFTFQVLRHSKPSTNSLLSFQLLYGHGLGEKIMMNQRVITLSLLAVLKAALGEEEALANRCDPSKCRSAAPGIFEASHNCWAVNSGPKDNWKLDACSDGYEAQDLSNVTTIHVVQTNTTFLYYTCCPMGVNPSVLDQCSDTACSSVAGAYGQTDCWADAPNEPMTCDGDVYTCPRKTGAKALFYSRYYSHYICCTTSDGSPPLDRNLLVAEGVRLALGILGLGCSLVLILGICSSDKARKHTYNLYIIFMALPDAIFNLVGILMGSFNVSGRPFSWNVVNFFVFFYSASLIWLSAIIAHQLYILLCNSKRRKRTQQPSRKRVLTQVVVVYFAALLMGTWMMLLLGGKFLSKGYFSGERSGDIAVAMSFLLMALVPFCYFTYITIVVWRQKLLPLNGRTRAISIYFLRIIFFFFIFWIPGIVMQNLEKNNTRYYKIPLTYTAW